MTEKTDLSEQFAQLGEQPSTKESSATKKPPGSGRLFIDIVVCILLPTLILKKLSSEELLGINWALVLALSLPLAVGVWEFFRDKKIGFVPALGFISILLTGGIGLLKLPKEYIAIKEALIPGILAVATVLSNYTKYPLIRTFLYNDMVMDTDKVTAHLERSDKQKEFDTMMINATWMLASSFILSAILNYLLAKWIVVSPSGTEAFNSELGTMTLYSYPVIVLPCMVITMYALYYVMTNIKKLTGLGLEDVVRH